MGKGEGKGRAAAHFDEGTLEVYKECFRLMDIDKDGVINKTDLRWALEITKLITKAANCWVNYKYSDALGDLLQPWHIPFRLSFKIKMHEKYKTNNI